MAEEDSDVLKHPSPDQEAFLDINKADARDFSELIESDESTLEENSVDFIITSPPYWQKRDYGVEDQIGQEETPEEFIDTFIDCMDEWNRILTSNGSLSLKTGHTYANRSLVGIPEMLMQAARENGWLVRNKILWAKPSGMPEPAPNRLANRHEYIFHFTQNNDYYYDLFGYSKKFGNGSNPGDFWDLKHSEEELKGFSPMPEEIVEQVDHDVLDDLIEYFYGPDAGDVWKIGHDRNTGGHLAPFPEELVERALVMGCPPATCSECGRRYDPFVTRHCPVCSTGRGGDRDDDPPAPGALTTDGGVGLSDHAVFRWDERTPADSVAPETAWAHGQRITDLERVTGADECRYHRPTETVLLRRDRTIVTVLLVHADPALANALDDAGAGGQARADGGVPTSLPTGVVA